MLLSCEQWRKDFGVDDIVKCVNFVLCRFAFPILIVSQEF